MQNMIKAVKQNAKELYQCQECGFHYEQKEWAKKCEEWCKEHHSCNLKITSHSIESKIENKQYAK